MERMLLIFQMLLLLLTTCSKIVKGFKFSGHAFRSGHNTFFFASNVDPTLGKEAVVDYRAVVDQS